MEREELTNCGNDFTQEGLNRSWIRQKAADYSNKLLEGGVFNIQLMAELYDDIETYAEIQHKEFPCDTD